MFFVRNELRTRRRFRFCTPCGYYCFNFQFFSFSFSWQTELDKSSSSITISTLSPRKSEWPRARYRQREAGWHIELDKLVASSVAQKTKLIHTIQAGFGRCYLASTRHEILSNIDRNQVSLTEAKRRGQRFTDKYVLHWHVSLFKK